FPFNRLSAAIGSTNSASPSEAPPSPAPPSQNQDQQAHPEKPTTGADEVLPTAPDQKSQSPSTGSVVDLPPQGAQAANPSPAPPNRESGSAASGENSSADPGGASAAENTQEAKATPPEVPERPAKTAKPKAKAPKLAAPAPAPGSVDADLELAGERYL